MGLKNTGVPVRFAYRGTYRNMHNCSIKSKRDPPDQNKVSTVIKNDRGKSFLWAHFGYNKRKGDKVVEQEVAVLFHCQKRIKLAIGTSNMNTHMH